MKKGARSYYPLFCTVSQTSQFFDVYHRFGDKKATIRHVVGHLFNPMLFTSLTTIAGFASLWLTPIPPVKVFGLHVAFGRSEHFGGHVGPAQFSRPEAVVHQDRVYVPALQPRISVARVDLQREDGVKLALMRDGQYVIDFDTFEDASV